MRTPNDNSYCKYFENSQENYFTTQTALILPKNSRLVTNIPSVTTTLNINFTRIYFGKKLLLDSRFCEFTMHIFRIQSWFLSLYAKDFRSLSTFKSSFGSCFQCYTKQNV
ncbi:hypothetical protein CEXT_414571 [Caerostris extrusa]|uniref:Uncharacterized protein n=1 Tax=Caerostris extrusa TaxID=172846 RepID=A0AAV4VVT2_CAEEX|nr:hypothetical protein CEXT_414571 [Caerostris extrusa]